MNVSKMERGFQEELVEYEASMSMSDLVGWVGGKK